MLVLAIDIKIPFCLHVEFLCKRHDPSFISSSEFVFLRCIFWLNLIEIYLSQLKRRGVHEAYQFVPVYESLPVDESVSG